jgi:hypothetical protein
LISGWTLRGTTDPSATPTIQDFGGTGPAYQAFSFPYVRGQYWDKWALKDNIIVGPSYTVTTELNFQNDVADRKDSTWDHIDIQPNRVLGRYRVPDE